MDQMPAAIQRLESLLSKSEKARGRVAVGSWQYNMLESNVAALAAALALMKGTPTDLTSHGRSYLQSFGDMIGKTETALSKAKEGSSQFSLLRNRLDALLLGRQLLQGD